MVAMLCPVSIGAISAQSRRLKSSIHKRLRPKGLQLVHEAISRTAMQSRLKSTREFILVITRVSISIYHYSVVSRSQTAIF